MVVGVAKSTAYCFVSSWTRIHEHDENWQWSLPLEEYRSQSSRRKSKYMYASHQGTKLSRSKLPHAPTTSPPSLQSAARRKCHRRGGR